MEGSKEKNYIRLQRLITLANRVLVDILRSRFPPNTSKYDSELQKLENKIKSNVKDPKLLHILYPHQGKYQGDFSELDISNLYQLLRSIGNIPGHIKGWGNEPDDNDSSLAASIERIRIIRNKHFHNPNGKLEDEDFNRHWKVLNKCILEHGDETDKEAINDILTPPSNAGICYHVRNYSIILKIRLNINFMLYGNNARYA